MFLHALAYQHSHKLIPAHIFHAEILFDSLGPFHILIGQLDIDLVRIFILSVAVVCFEAILKLS